MLEGMSLGLTPMQADVFTTTSGFCEGRVSPDSIYGLLHRECREWAWSQMAPAEDREAPP